MRTTEPPSCNCCGELDWEYAFTERSFDLGRCRNCGMYYVSQMPSPDERVSEIVQGQYAEDQKVPTAHVHLQGEKLRSRELQSYIDVAQRYAVEGTWLDVGCGTGMLIKLAQTAGIDIEGLELMPERRELARQMTSARIHELPLEKLGLESESLAAILMIYVFSHLTDPSHTFNEVHRVLKPGGILLIKTSEVSAGAQRRHAFDWNLGDHLYFLGENTIEQYAAKCGFELIHRNRVWQPTEAYSKERFRMRGQSRTRNTVKAVVLHTPMALRLLRWYMLSSKQRGNPVYSSILVLRKV